MSDRFGKAGCIPVKAATPKGTAIKTLKKAIVSDIGGMQFEYCQ
jgi:hypothetical protein